MELQRQMQRQISEWILAFAAWCSAIGVPLVIGMCWKALTHNDWKALTHNGNAPGLLYALFGVTAPVALSCYFGIRAHRQGSRIGYFLKFIVPLTLLGISTLAVLVLKALP
jgi:hypothetical protein